MKCTFHEAQQRSKHKAAPKGDKATKQTPKQPSCTKRKCYHFGRDQDHKLKECLAFGQTCNTHREENHFTSVSLSSKSSKQHVHGFIAENNTGEEIFRITVSSVKGQANQTLTNLNFLSDSGHLRIKRSTRHQRHVQRDELRRSVKDYANQKSTTTRLKGQTTFV